MAGTAVRAEVPVRLAKPRPHRTPARYEAIANAVVEDAQRLEDEIDEILDDARPSPAFESYRAHYESGLGAAVPRSVLRRSEAVEAAAGADVTFVGDMHSSRAAQRVALDVLRALHDRDGRPSAAVLEIARPEHQGDLDAYVAGSIDTETLLERIDFEGSWGFPPQGYVAILEYARDNGIQLVAGNTKGSLMQRDSAAAEIIASRLAQQPELKVMVMFGTYHLSQKHLPDATADALAEHGFERSMSRVLSGDHDSYFWLAKQGLYPQAARFDANTYVVYANSPRTSLKAHLRYLEDILDE